MRKKVLIFVTYKLYEPSFVLYCSEELGSACRKLGYDVEILKFPISMNFNTLSEQALSLRLLELNNTSDICIALGVFSNFIRHKNKRVWCFGLFDPIYSLFNTPFGLQSGFISDNKTKKMLTNLDMISLNESVQVHCASEFIYDLIVENCENPIKILRPNITNFIHVGSENERRDYLCLTDLADSSRFDLLIGAFERDLTGSQLNIVGNGEQEFIEALIRKISYSEKKDKINLIVPISNKEIWQYIFNAKVILSTEFASSKVSEALLLGVQKYLNVITTNDSGIIASAANICSNINIVKPSIENIAKALKKFEMGHSAKLSLESPNEDWPDIARNLLS